MSEHMNRILDSIFDQRTNFSIPSKYPPHNLFPKTLIFTTVTFMVLDKIVKFTKLWKSELYQKLEYRTLDFWKLSLSGIARVVVLQNSNLFGCDSLSGVSKVQTKIMLIFKNPRFKVTYFLIQNMK